jgi:hypothetical protein
MSSEDARNRTAALWSLLQPRFVDHADVLRGALDTETGALYQLGVKYFHELYFDQIGADEYRDVLRAMPENFDAWITKAEIRKKIKNQRVNPE